MVIASHQKSSLSEFVLGSVAAHCTTHSSRPVLVLHAPHAGPDPPGLLDRLASAAASVLSGGGQQEAQAEAAESGGGGADVAVAHDATVDSGCACQLRRNLVVAVDDSGTRNRRTRLPGKAGSAGERQSRAACCPLPSLYASPHMPPPAHTAFFPAPFLQKHPSARAAGRCTTCTDLVTPSICCASYQRFRFGKLIGRVACMQTAF